MSFKCARCGAKGKSLTLSSFFLCDICTNELVANAFNGNKPLFEGCQVEGFCYLCGNQTRVKLRQWILCEDCNRIVHSYPIGILAQKCVLKWLNQNISSIKFELTDPVILLPYSKKRKTKKIPQPDITGYDDKGNKILMIEVKTGRSSINDMENFQLDISDCDDILEYVKREQIATYIFHVQIVEVFTPPTSRFICAGFWWTNIFELSENFQRTVKRRMDRGKIAAYYDPRCFKRANLFVEEMRNRKYEILTKRLREGSIPILYKVDTSRNIL
jgi:hypothetical protein